MNTDLETWHVFMFRNCAGFYDEELSTPRPTPKIEEHSLSAVRNNLFSIFAATLHIVDRSSIRNPRTGTGGGQW